MAKLISGTNFRRLLVVLVMVVLLFPAIHGNKGHKFAIQERRAEIPKPTELWNGLIEHKWQPYLEQHFLDHINNLRSLLILSYNEAIFRLFPSRPNNGYIWTPELGFYPVDTIRRLNGDVIQHDEIEELYKRAAHRLKILQDLLGHHGVTLLMVTPPPKARIYPEYIAQYLVKSPSIIVKDAISYGDVLQQEGVNVINVQQDFLKDKAASTWPFFAPTGFHWNFLAACSITDAILRKAETLSSNIFFPVNCSKVEYGRSKWTDTDISAIINVLSPDRIIGNSPFPDITPQHIHQEINPKIAIVGDSYSDQIIYTLLNALPERSWSPEWLTRYDGYVRRQTFNMAGITVNHGDVQKRDSLNEILHKQLLILEVSDGNIFRDNNGLSNMEFGATQALLDGMLSTAGNDVELSNLLTNGWATSGQGQWHTTGFQASFAIRPPTNEHPVQLALDLESLAKNQNKPRTLNFLLNGKLISQVTMPSKNRGELDLTLTNSAPRQGQDSLVDEISIQDSAGQPLNLLLHGVRILGGDIKKNSNSAISSEATPLVSAHRDAASEVINLISDKTYDDISVEGLSSVEGDNKGGWRWATGPSTSIKFYIDPMLPEAQRHLMLKFVFKNGASIPEQGVAIRFNDKEVYSFSPQEISSRPEVDAELALAAQKGVNVLEFDYRDWNHGKKDYSADPRKLAVVFTGMSLGVYPAQKKFPNESSLIQLLAPPPPPSIATKLPLDLLFKETGNDFESTGLSGIEGNNNEKWRWATGQSTRVIFHVDSPSSKQTRELALKLAFKNGVPIPGQTVTVFFNGKSIQRFSAKEIGVQKLVEADVALNAPKGRNVLEFRYRYCSHCKKSYGSNDPRELAVVFLRMIIEDKSKD